MRNPQLLNTNYYDIEKMDGHMHLNCRRDALLNEANSENFAFLTINTEVPEFPAIATQQALAVEANQKQTAPLHHITTFSTKHWPEPFWQDHAIQQIKEGIESGAVGVKMWKRIGMELRDENGEFVMPDHSSFDPIYTFLEERNIPLLAHFGEPKNCWLPLDEMTVLSDKEYFAKNSEYHMYLHKEYPSYEKQMEARDRMLAKHKNLTFIGAHLASLEWSVDEIADWLDKYPGCGVDLAERVCHLQYQAALNHQQVKDFMVAYQDRIIYGTDQIDDGTVDDDMIRKEIRNKWHSHFLFFAENSLQTTWKVKKEFRGLGLDHGILKKVFSDNAFRYYPRLKS